MKRAFILIAGVILIGAGFVKIKYHTDQTFINTTRPRAWLSDAITSATSKASQKRIIVETGLPKGIFRLSLDATLQDKESRIITPFYLLIGADYWTDFSSASWGRKRFRSIGSGLYCGQHNGYGGEVQYVFGRNLVKVQYIDSIYDRMWYLWKTPAFLISWNTYLRQGTASFTFYGLMKKVDAMDYRQNINNKGTGFFSVEKEFGRVRLLSDIGINGKTPGLFFRIDANINKNVDLGVGGFWIDKGFNPLLSSLTYDGNEQYLGFIKLTLNFFNETLLFSPDIGAKNKRDKMFYYISGYIRYKTPRWLFDFYEKSEQPWGAWADIDHLENTRISVSYNLWRNLILRYKFEKVFDGYYKKKYLWSVVDVAYYF